MTPEADYEEKLQKKEAEKLDKMVGSLTEHDKQEILEKGTLTIKYGKKLFDQYSVEAFIFNAFISFEYSPGMYHYTPSLVQKGKELAKIQQLEEDLSVLPTLMLSDIEKSIPRTELTQTTIGELFYYFAYPVVLDYSHHYIKVLNNY